MEAVAAACAFIEESFPDCDAAFVAGSVVRGEATSTSDLDIVIVTAKEPGAFRKSLIAFGWPIEVFVHTHSSYHEFFLSDIQRRQPALPGMCAEGIILQDRQGVARRIQEEARQLLAQGPAALSPSRTEQLRYQLTDALDDFLGSQRRAESLFIAHELALCVAELILSHHRRWLGRGKWMLRALRAFDVQLAERLTTALEIFYQTDQKDSLIAIAEEALALEGGRLFAGYMSRADAPSTNPSPDS